MNFLKIVNSVAQSNLLRYNPVITTLKRTARFSPCDTNLMHPVKKPCFDLKKVTFLRAGAEHEQAIKSFLYTYHWPREPSVVSLWMPLCSPYLQVLSDKYSCSGDRLMAFERLDRTNENKLIGVAIANKIYPWMIDELEEWGHATDTKAEKHRMYFTAHCLKAPNVFKKYNTSYVYEIEVITTVPEVAGQGVATCLLTQMMDNAMEVQHRIIQVVASSTYLAKVCERCGMKREWSMDYNDFVDDAGQRVFFPRRPHHSVAVYIKQFNPKDIHAPKQCLKALEQKKKSV